MSDTPPVIAPPLLVTQRNRYQEMARASWVAPLLAFGVGFAIILAQGGDPRNKVHAITGAILVHGGLVLGIIALFGISKYGKKGILFPALMGIIVNSLIIVLSVLPLLMMPKRMHLQPALHAPTARILNDERLKVSLDIPEGFNEFVQGKQMQRVDHCYLKGDLARRQPEAVFSVVGLGRMLPQKREIPHNFADSRTNFNWRGISVDAYIVHEDFGVAKFITFNIQLPTVPQALQVSVGGPESHREEIEQVIGELLPTIDAQSNW